MKADKGSALTTPRSRRRSPRDWRWLALAVAGIALVGTLVIFRPSGSRELQSKSAVLGGALDLWGETSGTAESKRKIIHVKGVVPRPHPPGWKPYDPMDYPKPKTFFDIQIDGQPAGRIIFELFTRQAPRAAENFRALCTGEKGFVPAGKEGAGHRYHYKGARFYRVIDQFICQTGIETASIYGGAFDDDPGALMLRHDKKGLLSAANIGPNTTTTHFSIVVAPAPHLDGHYPIFGQVVCTNGHLQHLSGAMVGGMDVVDRINALARTPGTKDESPKKEVIVSNCGELKCDKRGKCKEITLLEA